MADPSAEPPASTRVLTVPNLLSFLRLLGVPVFLWLILVPQADGWAFALLAVAGASD
jgi:phosphatidylglycerophosphate synthase